MKSSMKHQILWAVVMAGVLSVPQMAQAEVFTLKPVVVTANRILQPITETKADISVINREMIENHHVDTLEKALRMVPGVQFLNYGESGINANLSGIRINGSNDVLLLIDGIRVNDMKGGGTTGYMYSSRRNNLGNVERIEVLRGSAGMIYGSGAVGGVINIITRKTTGRETLMEVSAGNFGEREYQFHTQGQNDKFIYRVYAGDQRRGDFRDGAGKLFISSSKMRNAGAQIGYVWTPTHRLTLDFDLLRSEYFGEDDVYHQTYGGFYYNSMWTLQHQAEFKKDWQHRFVYRLSDENDEYWQRQAKYGLGADTRYQFISEQLTFHKPYATLVFGVDYSRAENRKTLIKFVDRKKIEKYPMMKNISSYAQLDWNPIKQVLVSLGARKDYPSGGYASMSIDSHTSYSGKLGFDFTNRFGAYLSSSDYFILPSVVQLFNSKNEKGLPGILPAVGNIKSLGLTYKIGDNHYVTMNWFKTIAERSIVLSYKKDPKTGLYYYENYANYRANGWNAQWMARLSENWQMNFGWTHLFQSAEGDNFKMGYYPKDKFTFAIDYNRDKWHVGFDGFYFIRAETEFYREFKEQYKHKGWPDDKYWVCNLKVDYSPNKNTQVYLAVDNVFNKLWAEHTDVVHHPNFGFDKWYSMPGRAYSVGVQYSW